jgi:DNA mismatch repair ATPase MutS
MAMCGSFIPASFASLRVTDAVMTRLNMTTSLESNRGSFCEELRETKAILQSLETSKSPLILIDELGRGTSTVDGLGISWSVCEQLIQSSALSLFVSHYAELAQLESLYHHVKLSHMAVVEDQEAKRLGFLHELRDGYTPEATRHYGIYTAGLTGIPKRVLQAAMKIARTLAANTERLQEAQPIPVSRTYCSLFSMLKLLKNQLQQDRSQLAGAVSSPADDLRDPQDPAQQRQASPVAQTTMEYIQSLATKYLSM